MKRLYIKPEFRGHKIASQLIKTIIEDGISNILSVQGTLKKYYKGQKREQERILLGSKIVQMVEGDE